jgi:hypothetical protein
MSTKVKNPNENITRQAFYNFMDWAENKCFNEILGCAKCNIDGLSLLHDVDEYNHNQIAFCVVYIDVEGNVAHIQVEMVDGKMIFTNLMDKDKETENTSYNNMTCEDWKKKIIDFLGYEDEDAIAELWNECVDHSSNKEYDKIFLLNETILKEIVNTLNIDECKEVIKNFYLGQFDANERYFIITCDNRLITCNSIWDYIDDLAVFYAYLTNYYKKEMYGRTWYAVNKSDLNRDNEWLVIDLPNNEGVMYSNNVEGYLVLYTNEQTYRSWI